MNATIRTTAFNRGTDLILQFFTVVQARLRNPVMLIYGSTDKQVGLFVRCHAADRDAVLEPIVANYPQATVAPIER